MIPNEHDDAEIPGELRETLQRVQQVDAPDPSPLFWDGFAERVNAAIDRPGLPERRWWSPAALGWLGAAAAIVIAALVLFRTVDRAVPEPAPTTVVGSGPAEEMVPAEDVEQDAAWALVRDLAGDLEYDEIEAAGVSPRPGAVDGAAADMSDDERAELVRLIQDEMKRTGA